MKTILVLDGHPDAESFCAALAGAYVRGAEQAGAKVHHIALRELQFELNLRHGYRQRTELEPDLLRVQQLIREADHLVVVHPVWWGGWPALLKGFFDRTFLPGFAFRYRENSVWWDKLLRGKTGHIITTMDQPYWYYRLMSHRPSVRQLKKLTLEFSGISPVRVSAFGPVRPATAAKREQWLLAVEAAGKKLK